MSSRPVALILLLMGSALGVSGCSGLTRVEKGPLVAYGLPAKNKSGPLIESFRIDLKAKDAKPPPSFFVVLPGGPAVRYDEIDLATARQHFAVDTTISELWRKRRPEGWIDLKGGGYFLAFEKETLVYFGIAWDSEPKPTGTVPVVAASREGPFWKLPLTMNQLRTLIGEPDRMYNVTEVTY